MGMSPNFWWLLSQPRNYRGLPFPPGHTSKTSPTCTDDGGKMGVEESLPGNRKELQERSYGEDWEDGYRWGLRVRKRSSGTIWERKARMKIGTQEEEEERNRRRAGGSTALGGCAGGWAGTSGVDHHPRASSGGPEHLGQRKGVKSLRNGRDF